MTNLKIETNDFNAKIIEEFRANEGRVGRPWAGTTLILIHHIGAKSGIERVSPLACSPQGDGRFAIVAANGGSPAHPDWYYNLIATGDGRVERGTETYAVTVRDVTGAERDRVYAEQARRYPGFAEYERKTAGIRTIPVLELKRG